MGVDILVFRRKRGSSRKLLYASAGFTLIAGLLVAFLTSCGAGLTTEQKLEDFRYLFGIIRDNHPYLELKARVEGYDWLAHEAEFQEAVANSRNDKEFVQAINRMLQMINSGHTTIMSPDLYQGICALPKEMKPWLDECAKTDAEKVAKWYSLLSNPLGYPKGQTLPFRAWYCGGEYVVYYVAESLGPSMGVSPGDTLVGVNGKPIHEFVESLRGLFRLRLDPVRRRLYLNDFLPPYREEPYAMEFRHANGTSDTVKLRFEEASGPKRTPSVPTNLGQSLPNIYTTMLAGGQVAYIHINQMTPFEQSANYGTTLREFYAQIGDTRSLIIDIRGNGGGDDRFWMQQVVRPLATEPLTSHGAGALRTGEYVRKFMETNASYSQTIEGLSGTGKVLQQSELSGALTAAQFSNLPPEVLGPGFAGLWVNEMTLTPSGEYPYSGKVFLLIDFTVFSSAESLAQFCKSSGWATLVGEPTGGGDDASTPCMVTLPNSGIPVFMATGMGLNSDFTANEETYTAPDVLIERDPRDIIKLVRATSDGRTLSPPYAEYDTVLRECLKLALQTP